MKRLLTMAIAAIALASAAMPTKEEIRKAAPLVGELMNPLVAEYKAKKKTAVEVGDSAMVYAKEAETEAAKFLLLKGAIWYFAQAKDDAKAVKATSLLREQVKNIPPKMLINDVLKPAIDRIGEQDVPGLFVQYRAASARATIASGDISRQQRAELLAVAEGWKEALAAFAKLGDTPPAKAARAEKEGKNLAAAADFWWSYAPEEESAKDAIKAHAAALYRKAIASGELTGLKKAIAEKRIATLPDSDSFAASTAKAEPAPAATGTTGVSPVAAPAPTGTTGVSPVAAGAATSSRGNSRYCVIDLSAGPSASRYPVQWLAVPPAGGFNTDEYKTSKLVLRRIEPGSFKMLDKYDVTLTRPFFCGVFEVTQKQYELVTGNNPSQFKKNGETCPVENVSYDNIRGSSKGAGWPTSSDVDTDSFMGRIRARTGMDFDLPTEAQWEYACRAGTTGNYSGNLDEIAWYGGNSKGTHEVGTKKPNRWGLYDMLGNTYEWCLDWENKNLSSGETDPKGASSGSHRMRRGGGWSAQERWCSFSWRGAAAPSVIWNSSGFRLCMTFGGSVGASARGNGMPVASAPSTTPQISLSANGRPKNKILQLGNGEKIDMIGCPAGSFQMSNCLKAEGWEPKTFHKVTITRPFWFSKTMLTVRQMEGIGLAPDDRKSLVDQIVREFPDQQVVLAYPPDVVNGVFDFLNRSLAACLPPGYVFRLPTEAELEYAWTVAGNDRKCHVLTQGTFKAFEAKGWLSKAESDEKNYWYKSKFNGIFLLPNDFPKNAWGINKVCETPLHFTLDRSFSASNVGVLDSNDLVYAAEEIDPLQISGYGGKSQVRRRGYNRMGRYAPACFTLVIGPDLMKERGITPPPAK